MTRPAQTTLAALVAAGVFAGCPAPATDAAAPEAAASAFSGCDEVRPTFGDGPLWLQVAPETAYCARPGAQPLFDELARRARFALAPGDFLLPLDDGAADVPFDVCGEGLDRDYASGDAAWTVERVDAFGRARVRALLALPLADGVDDPVDGGVDEEWTYELSIDGFADELAAGVLIDGRPWPADGSTTVTQRVCRGTTCAGSTDVRALAPCAPPAATDRHVVEHARGRIEVVLAVDGSRYDVVSAQGVVDEETFAADPYWQALARPADDGWGREVLVEVDPPIDDVCAVHLRRVLNYDGWPEGVEARVVDCDGTPFIVPATAHTYEQIVVEE